MNKINTYFIIDLVEKIKKILRTNYAWHNLNSNVKVFFTLETKTSTKY